jgi:enamine deaminase RidA (YjgF/YER057c/UK114 family)
MTIRRINPGSRMSQAVVHNGVLYSSGMVDATASDVPGQTANVLAKIDAILTQAGLTRASVISAHIWLRDIRAFDEMNAVWDAWIDPGHPPVRATVESKLAMPGYLVEIQILAAVS